MDASNSTCFDVRAAQPEDVAQLVQLSGAMQRDKVASTEHGFLRNAFGASVFAGLIRQNQLVVGVADDRVVGYYLLHTPSTDGALAGLQAIVEQLRRQGKVSAAARVGVGAQACIAPAYQGQGLRIQMLHLLLEQLEGRYEYAFSTISKENPRAFRAHTNDGWQLVGAEKHYHHVV